MSCDAPVAAIASLFLASWHGASSLDQAALQRTALAGAPAPVASEPLFADIVARAGKLRGEIDAFRAAGGAPANLAPFKIEITELAALDEKGHEVLLQRGGDGDLKCILHGISQDLPKKLADMQVASDAKSKDTALKEMGYLLRDNVEVITTPASVTSGT
jgi:hypothetical protein